jgi:hypothetical protein
MSMRGACENRTICEVLREINDILHGNPAHKQILPKLIEAEKMAKKMSGKLVEYNKEIFAGWWEKNPDYEKDIKRRLSESYLSG